MRLTHRSLETGIATGATGDAISKQRLAGEEAGKIFAGAEQLAMTQSAFPRMTVRFEPRFRVLTEEVNPTYGPCAKDYSIERERAPSNANVFEERRVFLVLLI